MSGTNLYQELFAIMSGDEAIAEKSFSGFRQYVRDSKEKARRSAANNSSSHTADNSRNQNKSDYIMPNRRSKLFRK